MCTHVYTYLRNNIYTCISAAVVFGNLLKPQEKLMHHNDVTIQREKLTFWRFFAQNPIHTHICMYLCAYMHQYIFIYTDIYIHKYLLILFQCTLRATKAHIKWTNVNDFSIHWKQGVRRRIFRRISYQIFIIGVKTTYS